jgi:F0F1-type ATP synthase assembly protein I
MLLNKNKKESSRIVTELSPYLNLGMEMAVTMGLGVLAGWYLDDWNGTSPIFIVICSILGAVLSLYIFLKQVLTLEKKNKKKE